MRTRLNQLIVSDSQHYLVKRVETLQAYESLIWLKFHQENTEERTLVS